MTVEDRRREVEALWGEGLTTPAIAERLGCTRATISMDIHYLRAIGRPIPRRRSRPVPSAEVTQRRSQVAALWREGYEAQEIAERLGSTEGRVDTDLRWLKLAGEVEGHPDRSQHPQRKARRDAVEVLWRKGMAPERIAAELGVVRSTVYEDLDRLRAEGREVPYRRPELRKAP